MSQHKTILNFWLFFFFLILCLFITGCATILVRDCIQNPSSGFDDEFSQANKQLSGVYSGFKTFSGLSYARIEILPASNDCKNRPVLELLLPMEKNSNDNAIAIARAVNNPENEQLPVLDKYTGQSVKIIFYSPSNDEKINIDKDMASMLSSYNWYGYPSVVIIAPSKRCGYSACNHEVSHGNFILLTPNIAYRVGSKADDIWVHSLEAQGGWNCENTANKITGSILKPFAVVFDVITSPVQLSAFIILSIIAYAH
jgi:hypothetical protein